MIPLPKTRWPWLPVTVRRNRVSTKQHGGGRPRKYTSAQLARCLPADGTCLPHGLWRDAARRQIKMTARASFHRIMREAVQGGLVKRYVVGDGAFVYSRAGGVA